MSGGRNTDKIRLAGEDQEQSISVGYKFFAILNHYSVDLSGGNCKIFKINLDVALASNYRPRLQIIRLLPSASE